MLRMGTQQVGNKLVRLFRQGDEARRVVSEVVDGKTITHVTDMVGKPIKSRMKSISTQQVGNKTVRTKDSLITGNGVYFNRQTVDRVYKDGSYVGKRVSSTYADFGKQVHKETADGRITYKEFNLDGILERRIQSRDIGNFVPCNNKGLPLPSSGDVIYNKSSYNNLSLREMKNKFYTENPTARYVQDGIGMDFLNKLDGKDILTPIKDQFSSIVEKFKNLS